LGELFRRRRSRRGERGKGGREGSASHAGGGSESVAYPAAAHGARRKMRGREGVREGGRLGG